MLSEPIPYPVISLFCDTWYGIFIRSGWYIPAISARRGVKLTVFRTYLSMFPIETKSPIYPSGENRIQSCGNGTNFIPASNFHYHFVFQIPFSDGDGMALLFAHPATYSPDRRHASPVIYGRDTRYNGMMTRSE